MSQKRHNLLLNRTFQYLGIILIVVAIGGGYWYWKNAQAGVTLNKLLSSQPVFDAASSANNGQFQPATYSWTHTTGIGDNRLLIVNVAGNVSSITYGGLGLTSLSSANYGGTYSQMWYLINPPSGSATVQVTLTGTACSAAGAMTFSGVDQDNPFGTASTNSNGGGGISVTVSSASNELVVDAIAQYVTTPTPNGSQTSRYSERNGNGSCAMLSAGSTKTGSVSTTMQWSEPSGYYSALVAAPIKGVSKDARMQSSFQNSLGQGLVGYWPFNGQDISGTTAYDRSGQGNNGTLTNGPTKTEGKAGQGLSFNGTNQYTRIVNASVLNPTTYVSASMWINAVSPPGQFKYLLSKGAASANPPMYGFYNNVSGNLQFIVQKNLSGTYYSPAMDKTLVYDGRWHHITGVYDGSMVRLYVDGVEIGSGTAMAGSIGTHANDLFVGSYDSTAGYFPGSIDEPRIYNRALSAGDVWDLYQMGNPDHVNSADSQGDSLEKGMVGYWKLDDGSGTSATDASGNANTGTLTNGPTWTTGRIGGATNFDGVDDEITITSPISGAPNVINFSVSFWIYWDSSDTFVPFRDNSNSAGTFPLYNSGGNLVMRIGGSTSGTLGATSNYTNRWVHFTLVNTPALATLYADGVNLGSVVPGGDTINSPLHIGRNGSASDWDKCKFDELRVYNRALSADEVTKLYKITAPDNPDTGLVGYWPFNGPDISGTTAYDRSGKGNNGTLTNGPTITEGKAGQGMSFDGSNDYIDIGNKSIIDGASAASICFWMKYAPSSVTADAAIVSKWSTAVTSGGFLFWVDDVAGVSGNTNTISFTIDAQQGGTVARVEGPSGLVTSGVWDFYCGTFQGNSFVRLYKNSVQVGESTASIVATVISSSKSIYIANSADASLIKYFPGSLDDVRIYNRALTTLEIQALYDAGR